MAGRLNDSPARVVADLVLQRNGPNDPAIFDTLANEATLSVIQAGQGIHGERETDKGKRRIFTDILNNSPHLQGTIVPGYPRSTFLVKGSLRLAELPDGQTLEDVYPNLRHFLPFTLGNLAGITTLVPVVVSAASSYVGWSHRPYSHALVLGFTPAGATFVFHVKRINYEWKFVMEPFANIQEPGATFKLFPHPQGRPKLPTWQMCARIAQLLNQDVRYRFGSFNCQSLVSFIAFDYVHTFEGEQAERAADAVGMPVRGNDNAPVSRRALNAKTGRTNLELAIDPPYNNHARHIGVP